MDAQLHTKGIEMLGFDPGEPLELPLLLSTVPAGFPSPSEDYIDQHLDLNEHVVRHPAATFFVRASGESMAGANIQPGDILVVDRALEPASGRIVIAALEGELTVKRLRIKSGRVSLEPANPSFKPVEILPDSDFEIWGVVTFIIHKA
ncbi:LexA family protein [Fundidesulfovibrio terrae]|uniref:LexA family protein n=1 Tax=Fundidesulfovibrio terrae TaxID=2922866 RepID=UPI001FAF93F9|nr:translesion error-prone DNA polymerase V autoproteolytic subunit [Fundidesulfovibrio terrae]